VHPDIAWLDLANRRRSLVGYCLGMAVYALAVVAMYPAFKTSISLDKLIATDSTAAALRVRLRRRLPAGPGLRPGHHSGRGPNRQKGNRDRGRDGMRPCSTSRSGTARSAGRDSCAAADGKARGRV
jgi:hypothetical protein